jgi:hypothetical protein
LRNGKKEGYGEYFYSNGNKYEGQWMEDKKHGHGIYTYLLTGERYEGDWRDGLK